MLTLASAAKTTIADGTRAESGPSQVRSAPAARAEPDESVGSLLLTNDASPGSPHTDHEYDQTPADRAGGAHGGDDLARGEIPVGYC